MKASQLFFVALLVVSTLASTMPMSPRHIGFVNRLIDTTVEAPLSQRIMARTSMHHPERADQFLLHVEGPITEELKASLNAKLAPYKLGKYIPHHTFVVVASADKMVEMESHPAVRWTGHYEASLRVQPDFAHHASMYVNQPYVEGIQHRPAMKADGTHDVRLVVATVPTSRHEGVAPIETAQALASLWLKDLPAFLHTHRVVSGRRVTFDVEPSRVEEAMTLLASLPEVHWVEVAPTFEISNYFAMRAMQIGQEVETLTTPLSDIGLDGTGQVIGVGDTGADYANCFFNDPNIAVPAMAPNVNNAHRKIVQYNPYVDATDDVISGHGSHVSGSVAGNAGGVGQYDTSNGMAYNAKLTISDIGNTQTGGLSVPNDIDILLQPAYDAGARIHTNSWGSPTVNQNGQKFGTAYSLTSAEMDDYMDRNRDFIVLVAAGNDGNAGSQTVGAPATAKSILAIAAGQNTLASWQNLCGLTNPSPIDYALNCQAAFQQALTASDGTGTYNSMSMAAFSSQGPLTRDQRIKPDLTSPGQYIVSAKSSGAALDNLCLADDGVVFMAGTSMATPLTAGAVGIVRQYFVDGFYPSGAANADDTVTPTGSLMKAILLNGAKDMTGTVEGGAPLGAVPNNNEGYGRTDLNASLYTAANSGEFFGLTVFANEEAEVAIETNGEQKFCFDGVESTNGIKVTLVWTDPAGSTAATVALINDIDLQVTTPEGETLLGNGVEDGVNPNEQVVIPAASSGEYCAIVKGFNVPEGPQTYSLVASGSMVGAAGVVKAKTAAGKVVAIVIGCLGSAVAVGASAVMFHKFRTQGTTGVRALDSAFGLVSKPAFPAQGMAHVNPGAAANMYNPSPAQAAGYGPPQGASWNAPQPSQYGPPSSTRPAPRY